MCMSACVRARACVYVCVCAVSGVYIFCKLHVKLVTIYIPIHIVCVFG